MALFGLTIVFSGCSKISLKPKKSLGPLYLIPNHRIDSSQTELNRQVKLREKIYWKLIRTKRGRKKLLILIHKQDKLCNNYSNTHKKQITNMMIHMIPYSSKANNRTIIEVQSKSYMGRFLMNCNYVAGFRSLIGASLALGEY